jgi:hypothetical protein
MRYQITQHERYLRAVIAEDASTDEFAALYRELQTRCTVGGYDRALVVVHPESAVSGADRFANFNNAGFIDGFRLALVCATWTLYQACNKAERAAARAAVNVRAFLQEMEAVRWLTGR